MALRSVSEFKTHLVKVWRSPTAILYLNRAARVFLNHSTRVQGQSYVRMVKTYARKHAHACTRRKAEPKFFSYLGCDSFTHDSYNLGDYSRHT